MATHYLILLRLIRLIIKNQVIIVNEVDGRSSAPLTPADFARSINLLTGLSVGSHYIVPAAFSSFNFDITYGVGNLTVQPATLTIHAKDTTMFYGGSLPVFTSTLAGVAYKDKITDILSGPPVYSLQDMQGLTVSGTSLNPGTYKIIPGSAPLVQSSNYTLNYLPGQLTVIGDPLTIRANDITILAGTALPVFTSAFTGLKAANEAASITPYITYTLTDAQNNLVTGATTLPKGIYVIRPQITNASVGVNYVKKYDYGILYVK